MPKPLTVLDAHAATNLHWSELIKEGWYEADRGNIQRAIKKYQEADNQNLYSPLNPELQVLRHSEGTAKGRVKPFVQSENNVIAIAVTTSVEESADSYGMEKPIIKPEKLEQSIRDFLDIPFNWDFHGRNVKKELPHIWVISTGRCGTVSLYRLFEQSRLMAFHSFLWNPSGNCQAEMGARFISGCFDECAPSVEIWLQSRSAEWIGAINEGRPMMSCAHIDTIFAPVFAKFHAQGKIVFLRRNPQDVFNSFYSKNQWSYHQVFPIFYAFNPYRWRRVFYDLAPMITWYIYFIEQFCEAMVRVMGDRAITISADKLFAQDKEEIQRLLDFTDCGIPLNQAVNHFAIKYNEKLAKQTLTQEGQDIIAHVFQANYAILHDTGEL